MSPASLEELVAPPSSQLTELFSVSSEHTKHALEVLHPNIAVFRHPDHILSGQVLESSIISGLKNLSLKSLDLAKLPSDSLKALYGWNDDIILYWAHHEKLCLVDGKTAFMGGLDLCFGRWDTNSHPIADAHPTDLDNTLFPGQDFNNARVHDFEDVSKYDHNKLDRTKSSRMGWSDLSICLQGPVVDDLKAHFVQRWNFIYNEKYDVRKDARYSTLSLSAVEAAQSGYDADGSRKKHLAMEGTETLEPGLEPDQHHHHHHHLPGGPGSIFDILRGNIHHGMERSAGDEEPHPSGVSIQLARSASRWSHGIPTEVSHARKCCLTFELIITALDCKCLYRGHRKQHAFRLHREPVLHHCH